MLCEQPLWMGQIRKGAREVTQQGAESGPAMASKLSQLWHSPVCCSF